MESKRLRFGVWEPADLDLAWSIWGDPEVTKLTGGPFSRADVRDRLSRELENQALHGSQYWPLFESESGGLIGACGLRPRPAAAGEFELGFQLCHSAWGRGYALEAAGRVIAWARDRGIATLVAGHHPTNFASRTVLARLGFIYSHDEPYAPTGLTEPSYRLVL